MAFVTITYGDNHQELFNPNCKTRIFLENVKKRCHCPSEMELELADEYGNLKNITTLPSSYANQVLIGDRELLIPIHVKRNKSDHESGTSLDLNDITYVPLLNNNDIVNARFKARLLNRDPDAGRPQSRTKRSSREKREKSLRRSTEMTSAEKQDDASSSQKRSGSSRNKGGSSRSSRKGRNK